jgi:hypothetical protein
MFASGLLRDRRDLQQQMRKDALCFAGNRNNTVETSTMSKQTSPIVQQRQTPVVVPTTSITTPPITTRSSLLNKKVVPPNE